MSGRSRIRSELSPSLCTCPHGDPAALRRARRRREVEKRSLYVGTDVRRRSPGMASVHGPLFYFYFFIYYLLPVLHYRQH